MLFKSGSSGCPPLEEPHRHGDMALVFGDAGAGKTTALEHYANDHTGVVMVTANACTSSAVSVLQMIG